MKKLSCHCGGVEIEVNVPDQFKKLIRCNCSLCKRKGIIMTIVDHGDLKVIKGQDLLKLYQYQFIPITKCVAIQTCAELM